MTRGPFRTLVFGGGGTRCFWHGGFMAATVGRLPLDVQRISALSNRLYAMPTKKPPTFKLDFTDAKGIRDAWGLGERNGRAFLERHFPQDG
ncbi:MAG TPA: hypothetical protein VMM55_08055 [Thermohalobaculum sp.]|nr:hypothetical protein [Thermohalobaculum sp.]